MRQIFASIQNPKQHAYVFDTGRFDMNARVHPYFAWFQTYDDGLIAHSPDYPLVREMLADYLISLAAYMLDHDDFAREAAYSILTHAPKVEDIKFAASVVFKPQAEGSSYEKKDRYFSTKERKISSAPSRQHDKRYERVTKSEDGTPAAIVRMLTPSYAGEFERLIVATAVRSWVMDQPAGMMEHPAVFLGWTKDLESARVLRNAVEAVTRVAEAFRLRECARGEISNARRRFELKAQADATAETTAA